KQLIEMNRITVARGDIGFNFTDTNLIKKIMVDKPTQTQLINGRLAVQVGTGEDTVPLIKHPVTYSRTPATYTRRPPALGADQQCVLAWIQTTPP
ncbi:DUF2058 family protein, partial [Klebsiella pneumoniae]|uniref:DUF2058 family protein n=1 Tax=Klebsiella pneumoniae TaxID=573 RepID=UPI002270A425